MEENPIQNDVRKTKRRCKLGENPACAHCGDRRPEVLEKHHLVGKANEPALTITLCRNCHAVATERLRQSGVSMEPPPTLLQRLLAILKGIACSLIQVAECLFDVVQKLSRPGTECPLCGNKLPTT